MFEEVKEQLKALFELPIKEITYEEINYSLCSHILKCKNKDSTPILLNEYFNNEYNNNIDSVKKVVEENREKLLKGYCNNNLPTKFEELLKNELKVL